MPNWCYNYITLSGEEDKIDRVKTILKLRKDDRFFKPLLGEADESNWYEENLIKLGTKWDVMVDCFYNSDDAISFSCESAWSPPIAGMVNVCKKYGVSCIMTYEEAGNDFYGKTTIDTDGTYQEEDYGYREGMYVLDNSSFWENLDPETYDMENMIEEMKTEIEYNTYTIDEFVKREFPYVDDYDAKKIMSILHESLSSKHED